MAKAERHKDKTCYLYRVKIKNYDFPILVINGVVMGSAFIGMVLNGHKINDVEAWAKRQGGAAELE